MDSKFIPTLQAGNGYTHLKLRGVLDEDNLLSNLISQIQGRLLLIDMSEMERINSCGVRDWVNWLNQIQALGLQVILLKCSPAVVAQANMVTNFAADAFIHSFYAPYVHPDTGDEQSVLLFTEDLRQNQPVRAPKIYSDSGEELEFDEFEDSYFAFVNDPRMMNFQVTPEIQAIIQYFVPESASHQPVVSGVKSNVNLSVSAPGMAPTPAGFAGPMAGPASMAMSGFGMGPGAGPAVGPGAGFGGMGAASMSSPAPSPSMYPPTNTFGNLSGPASPNHIPTPAAPMRHDQPPLPSNAGYQQLPQTPRVPESKPTAPISRDKGPATRFEVPIANVPGAAPLAPSEELKVNVPAAAPTSISDQVVNSGDIPLNGGLTQRDKRRILQIAVVVLVIILIVVIVVAVLK